MTSTAEGQDGGLVRVQLDADGRKGGRVHVRRDDVDGWVRDDSNFGLWSVLINGLI